MRRLSIAVVAAGLPIVLSAGALAADLPTRPMYTKAPVVAVWSWTGCYIGGDVGYAWGRDSDVETANATGAVTAFSPADAGKPNGPKVGGYLGCNWQASGQFVLGVEADGEWANLRATTNYTVVPGFGASTYETRISSEGSVRGRIGYAFDHVLPYVTGGVAFAHVNEHDLLVATGAFDDSSTTRTGWTVGAGLDYAFTGNWIGRVEYRYADFGTFSYVPALFTFDTEHHRITENVIRVGLAYKFW